ncbi:MAG: ABC transporter ATP-binding protein [Pyrinomonadaceae bacterium]
MKKAIEVKNLSKTYGTGETAVHALRNVDLDVFSGQVTLLMGASGSGKTTLLSIMGCILRASSGSIQIHGREVTALSEAKLPKIRLQNIGFVFQGFNLFPALTAGENVELALNLKGVRGFDARRKACELLELVELGEKFGTHPSELSGGQKQRVAIARALAGNPSIILADEPTAALDSQSGRTISELLRDLARRQNRAVVIVTHDNRLLEYADRIVHIVDGKIVESEEAEGLSNPGGKMVLGNEMPNAALVQ